MDQTNFGQLITELYRSYLDLYKDEELAAVATAATINEILSEQAQAARSEEITYAA